MFGVKLVERGAARRQRYLVSALVATILVLLAPPADVGAEPGYEVRPGGIRLVLPVAKGDKGVLSVSANERQRVQFRLDGHSSTTEYATTGRVSSRRIEATFGALGRVHVRLNLTPLLAGPRHEGRCKGRAPLYQEGTYSGTIRFAHQGEVPRVSAKRGHAYFSRRFRQVCKKDHRSFGPGRQTKLERKVEVGALAVSGKSEGRTVVLEASTLALRGHPARSLGRLSASVHERREQIRISKTASVPIDNDSFAMSGHDAIPQTVEVEPPTPFVGRALYSRGPGASSSWTGDLGIELPDAGTIRLTGPGLSAAFCRSSFATRFARCASLFRP